MQPSMVFQAKEKEETAVLLLLDCIHPSVRERMGADALGVSFKILHRILSNTLNHPKEARFARINASSRSWREGVLPCYYPLRLQEWLGLRPSSGEYVEFVNDNDKRGFAGKLEELEVVRRAWAPTTSESSPNGTKDEKRDENINNNNGMEGELQRLLRPPPQGLLPPLQTAAWEGGKRLMRLLVLRDRLKSTKTASSSSSSPSLSSCAEEEGKLTIAAFSGILDRCMAAEWKIIGRNDDFENFCGAFTAKFAPVVSIPILEECQRVVDAAKEVEENEEWLSLFRARKRLSSEGSLLSSPSTRSFPINTDTKTKAEEDVRRRIVERHRAGYLLDARQDLLSRTGEAYRRLSPEEQRCGVSLILDIAAFIEQVALVEENQTMLRRDRLEARRLLDRFTQDGNLTSLHALRDFWEDKLEAAKTTAGKQTVFLN